MYRRIYYYGMAAEVVVDRKVGCLNVQVYIYVCVCVCMNGYNLTRRGEGGRRVYRKAKLCVRKLIYDFSRGKNIGKQAHRFIPINYNIVHSYRFCPMVIKCNTTYVAAGLAAQMMRGI